MKQVNFKSPTFFWIVIGILAVLLLWNIYALIRYSWIAGLLPISVQLVLLLLLFMKHKYAKVGIKFWAIVFLVIASGLQFFGRLLQDISQGFNNIDIQHYISSGALLLIGLFIVIYTNKSVEIIEEEIDKSSP